MEFEAYKVVHKSVLEEIAKKNEQAAKGGKS
jgi:hypothetical protein